MFKKTPLLSISRRFVSREAIHRYVEPDKYKKHILAAAEPYYKRKYYKPSETCRGLAKKDHQLEPLDEIYVNELLEEIRKNDFVLFIQHNYTPFQSERIYKNTLTKAGGNFFSHKNAVYKSVFKQLNIDRVQDLFVTRNSLVIGKVDKLPACVRAMRKMPQFLLLAGCIDGQVVTNQDLQLISITSNIDESRAYLMSVLETPAIELAWCLEQHSNNISPQGETSKE